MSILDEGLYYEKIFSPVRIEVRKRRRKIDKKTGKPVRRSWTEARRGDLVLILEDQNGEKLKVEGVALVSRVLGYLQPYTGLKISEMKKLPEKKLQGLLDNAMVKVREDKKQFKALFDDKKNLCGIASTMHKQISWRKVREIIEKAIKEVCGQVVKPEGYEHPYRWTYRLPIENENVSGWVGVHAGNNIIRGRSGIHVWSRWRTEREEYDRGGIRRPACLNWCGMWEAPVQFFGIDVKRLDNIYKVVGAENVKMLKLAQFHINPDLEKFGEQVKTQLEGMVRAMEKMQVVIDDSIYSPLKLSEMEAILEAYRRKAGLPKYIIRQILDYVVAMGPNFETVWGFSNAVSWVRTHGEFKNFAICKPREDRELTRKLENIAGEVLSLTPTINDFHDKYGDITLEKLLPNEKDLKIEVRAQL